MATQTAGVVSERPGSAAAPEEDAGVESPRRILCRVCRTGVLKLYMCGPRFITLCGRFIVQSIIVV